MITLEHLRRFTIARSLFKPTTLKRALGTLGFVQADPIRAPARAQDLTLRHRVKDYRAGDLERLYPRLGIAEDFFVTYGFVTDSLQALMHPRLAASPWSSTKLAPAKIRQSLLLLDFVRERGAVHPREADEHFAQGTVKNAWGGTSNATTHLLDSLHYRGLLRVERRDGGIRIYAAHQHGPAPADAAELNLRLDALVDAAVSIYAPLPGSSLASLVRELRHAVPQWRDELPRALQRARQRLATANVEGIDWYWPAGERASSRDVPDAVRLLAPFDPVVRDRARFRLLWGWDYRFEAYTPVLKRKLGYYALPLLWRDQVIGWGNLSAKDGELEAAFGYTNSHAPRERSFRQALEAELERVRLFLGIGQ